VQGKARKSGSPEANEVNEGRETEIPPNPLNTIRVAGGTKKKKRGTVLGARMGSLTEKTANTKQKDRSETTEKA